MSEPEPQRWLISERESRAIALDRPVLMGVLNVTPDSFSDGGLHAAPDDALRRADQMAREGATIIDVGGESTRPGATRADADQQLRRVLPVIERIRTADLTVAISVDTTRATVARAALEAGATIVNDVSGATEDPEILRVAAEHGSGLILMHRLRAPGEDRYSDTYDEAGRPNYSAGGGVVEAVRTALEALARRAIDAGIRRDSIVLDPGLGFGKTVEQNFALIHAAARLMDLGHPLLSGASRKSFIGRTSGVEEPARRVHGTVAASVAHYLAGVRIFRVHDVRAHAEALAVAAAIAGAREDA